MKASHLLPTASILRRCIALLVVEIDHRAGKYLIFRAIQKQFLYVYKLSLDYQYLTYMSNTNRSVSGHAYHRAKMEVHQLFPFWK